MKKKRVFTGKDYTFMQPVFKELLLRTGVIERDNIIFTGCPGACYSMATYLSFTLEGLKLNLYYCVSCNTKQIWKLRHIQDLGVVATQKVKAVKAKVVVLMSGLCRIPFEDILKFVDNTLLSSGKIIGDTVVPGLFEQQEWDKHIHFDYIFEYETVNPTSYEIHSTP